MTTIPVNEGKYDRYTRVALGTLLVATGISLWNIWGLILVVIGLVPMFSGLVGWCPLYAIFKIDTRDWLGG